MGSFPSANPSLPTSVPGIYVAESAGGISPTLPTLVGFTQVALNGAATLPATGGTLPGGILEGDLLLALVCSSNFTSLPPGWLPVFFAASLSGAGSGPNFAQANNVNGTAQKLYAFWRLAVNGEPLAAMTFGATLVSAGLLVFRGATNVRALAVVDGQVTDGSGNARAPGFYTGLPNQIGVLALASVDGAVTPSGYTVGPSIAFVGGTNFSLQVYTKAVSTAGVTAGPLVASTAGAAHNYGAVSMLVSQF